MSGDYKRLYRSQSERIVAGVCGGIGTYLNVDPTLIRLIFVALGFTSIGTWLLVYFVLAIIMPLEPEAEEMLAVPGPTSTTQLTAEEA
jgi:phage shock protein C